MDPVAGGPPEPGRGVPALDIPREVPRTASLLRPRHSAARSALVLSPAALPAAGVGAARRRAALVALVLLAAGSIVPAAAAPRRSAVPYSVRVEVRWGVTRNRETYRRDLQHALVETLLAQRCFERVREDGPSALLLDVMVEDLLSEEEYLSTGSLLPGQGESHRLLFARASAEVDYWLVPAPAAGAQDEDSAILASGHFLDEIVREPLGPDDPTEERAVGELLRDISRWIGRELCAKPEALAARVRGALADPSPPSAPAPGAPNPDASPAPHRPDPR